tara:strand:- start:2152 stop:2457 length:306 start_codon:yes stop_codon:yes gene_type:complete
MGVYRWSTAKISLKIELLLPISWIKTDRVETLSRGQRFRETGRVLIAALRSQNFLLILGLGAKFAATIAGERIGLPGEISADKTNSPRHFGGGFGSCNSLF